jgi:hypothetical protein
MIRFAKIHAPLRFQVKRGGGVSVDEMKIQNKHKSKKKTFKVSKTRLKKFI